MRYNAKYPAKWRKYQAGLQKNTKRNHYLKKLPFLLTIAGGLLTVLVIFLLAGFRISDHWSRADQNSSLSEKDLSATQLKLTRKDLAVFLTDISGDPLALTDRIVHKNEGGRYTIRTIHKCKASKLYRPASESIQNIAVGSGSAESA